MLDQRTLRSVLAVAGVVAMLPVAACQLPQPASSAPSHDEHVSGGTYSWLSSQFGDEKPPDGLTAEQLHEARATLSNAVARADRALAERNFERAEDILVDREFDLALSRVPESDRDSYGTTRSRLLGQAQQSPGILAEIEANFGAVQQTVAAALWNGDDSDIALGLLDRCDEVIRLLPDSLASTAAAQSQGFRRQVLEDNLGAYLHYSAQFLERGDFLNGRTLLVSEAFDSALASVGPAASDFSRRRADLMDALEAGELNLCGDALSDLDELLDYAGQCMNQGMQDEAGQFLHGRYDELLAQLANTQYHDTYSARREQLLD